MTRFGALQLRNDGTQTIIVGLLPENGCLLGGGVDNSRPSGGTAVPAGRPSDTVVPGAALRKIPPACPPSGDAPGRPRLIPSSGTVHPNTAGTPRRLARTWRLAKEMTVKQTRIQRPRARRERPWRELFRLTRETPISSGPRRSPAPAIPADTGRAVPVPSRGAMRDSPPASASMNGARGQRDTDRSGGTMPVRRRQEADSVAETPGQRAARFDRDALPYLAQRRLSTAGGPMFTLTIEA